MKLVIQLLFAKAITRPKMLSLVAYDPQEYAPDLSSPREITLLTYEPMDNLPDK
jgi:hypothetical protein